MLYAAEWPCCHDPLRFSPCSEDLSRAARVGRARQPTHPHSGGGRSPSAPLTGACAASALPAKLERACQTMACCVPRLARPPWDRRSRRYECGGGGDRVGGGGDASKECPFACWPELWVPLALCSDRSSDGCSPHYNRVLCFWWASEQSGRVCRGRLCDLSLRLRSM